MSGRAGVIQGPGNEWGGAMSERPEGTPLKAAANGSGGLLATKLYVPRPPSGFVPRPRLVDQLDGGLARGLTVVCAPAGFGKTALLASWAHRSTRPVAWLSLDRADSDRARFWRHAVAALERARPGIAERVAPLLGPPPPPSFEGLVTALINELAAEPGETLLVLDDYHLIDSQPVHASLTFLLEHLPPELRLVLTSRADPPLPLARLRARGQLAELRAADLRFTQEEAAALLRQAVGPDLPDAAVAALAARTEGWAAGLQLAALSLRGQTDVVGFVASFSGSHRYVLDYLADEVLEGQPERVRGFLLETSVLERLSGALCDAVTGRTDSQAMLEQVERANLFLVPLDEVRGWWRYHQLFADLLRARLQQQRPERVQELHRNAAGWAEAHGLADDAVRHALAAGEVVWAARLIERHADALVVRSERATMQRWLRGLPAELVGSRPRLLLAQALLALLGGDVEAVEALLDAAERAFAAAPGEADEPYEPSVGRAASVLADVPAMIALERGFLAELRGDADRAITFERRALAELGEGQWMLESHIRMHLGVAEWLSGRVAAAERAFASSITRWRAAGEGDLAARGCYQLGLVQRAQGRLDAALETYHQALQLGAARARPALLAAAIAHVGMAEVAYQRDELDAALRHVSQGIPLCRQLTRAQPLATGLATLAWIRQAQGDVGGALDAIGEAERVAPGPEVVGLFNPVPAQRARLLLAQGEVAGVLRWTTERGLAADDEPSYPQEPGYLVLARVLLAEQAPDRALGLLGRLHALAVAQGRVGSVIEIQALRALALAVRGDQAEALASLAEALSTAAAQGYVRVFVDEGAPMGALLGRLVAALPTEQLAAGGVPPDYLGKLVGAFEQTAAAGAPLPRPSGAVVAGLVEALSARELQVLRLLAAGKQNREIAEELWLAPNTVKKHVTHILDKLGATNRTAATARARELGLLS
jgi:LuxR family transcriptional regulator, maltose regulon positive regulatory protein